MTTIAHVLESAQRRTTRLAAGGLLVIPLLVGSCEPACTPAAAPRIIEQRQIGTSVQGQPIIATRVGTPGGVPVLAIGSIHGDEQAGIEIVETIRDTATIPAGFDVWIIPSINPDGNLAGTHTNAAGVDLNRNFPPNWEGIDCTTAARYCSGPTALSEPESQAIASFVTEIRPLMTAWYHGPLYVIDAATTNGVADPDVLYAYGATAEYGVATVACSPTGYCTGNATQYMNASLPGTSAFVVELSTSVAGAINPKGVSNHVDAFFAAAAAAAAV